MITPGKMVFADSRARFVRVISSLHMHFSCILRAFVFALRITRASVASPERVKGVSPLCPCGMSRAQRLERPGGSAVGGFQPPFKYGYRESEANGAFQVISRAQARTARASARARAQSIYLMITVPIDTMFIINHLQKKFQKTWCQIVLFLKRKDKKCLLSVQ